MRLVLLPHARTGGVRLTEIVRRPVLVPEPGGDHRGEIDATAVRHQLLLGGPGEGGLDVHGGALREVEGLRQTCVTKVDP